MGNLEKKLGEIKYLKQEWDIGTKDAYDYLKSQEQLAAFRKHHENEGALNFSNRQIANIADEFALYVQKFLDSCATISAEKNEAYPRENVIERLVPTSRLFNAFGQKSDNIWICDYDSLLSIFLGHYDTFSKYINNEKAKIYAAFNYTLAESLFKEIPILYNLEQKPHLVTEIVSNDKLNYHSKNSIQNDTLFINGQKDAKGFLRQCGLLLKLKFNRLPFVPKPDCFSRHEIFYLLSYSFEKDDLYERAVKELTLKRQDTQRKIALNYALLHSEEEKTIEKVISRTQDSVNFNLKNLSKLEELSAPSRIISNSKNNLKKKIYFLKALKNNRKWLEQMLSH